MLDHWETLKCFLRKWAFSISCWTLHCIAVQLSETCPQLISPYVLLLGVKIHSSSGHSLLGGLILTAKLFSNSSSMRLMKEVDFSKLWASPSSRSRWKYPHLKDSPSRFSWWQKLTVLVLCGSWKNPTLSPVHDQSTWGNLEQHPGGQGLSWALLVSNACLNHKSHLRKHLRKYEDESRLILKNLIFKFELKFLKVPAKDNNYTANASTEV